RSIIRVSARVLDDLMVLACELLRSEFKGQFGKLSGEAERHLVVLVIHRRSGIHANVERLVESHDERNRMGNFPRGDLAIIDLQYAGAALAEARTIVHEVEYDGMFPGRERLLALPPETFHIDEVVGEHRLAVQQV